MNTLHPWGKKKSLDAALSLHRNLKSTLAEVGYILHNYKNIIWKKIYIK